MQKHQNVTNLWRWRQKIEESRMEFIWNVHNNRCSKECKMLRQTWRGTLFSKLSLSLLPSFPFGIASPHGYRRSEACINKLSFNSYLNVFARPPPMQRKKNIVIHCKFWSTAAENESLIDLCCLNWMWLSEWSDWCLRLINVSFGWSINLILFSASRSNLSVLSDKERFPS